MSAAPVTNLNEAPNNVPLSPRTLWQKLVLLLVEPAADVPFTDYRNARLSTWLTLLLVLITWPVVVFLISNSRILMGAVIFTISYLLCRTRHFKIGIYILVFAFGFVALLSASSQTNSTQTTMAATLLWLIPIMLIASSVLPMRPNMMIVGIFVAAILLMPLYASNKTFAHTGLSLAFVGLAGGLILIFLNHRNLLERDRRTELLAANDALRISEANLEQRVIERTQQLETARREAETAQQEAEKANEVKSQFLANMSHELRTPLNAILNFTAFVSDGIMGPVNDEQVEALQQSISSGKHLLALINDVLDITKIKSGLMDMFIQEADLNEALAVVVSMSKGLVKDKPIKLETEIEANLPITFGDKRRLRQVFLNIVSNALKFTREGSVTIRAINLKNYIRFEVQDTGIGIAPEDQYLVFKSFKQAKHDLLDTPGTGLGMPISKFFVEAHGGQIWFESTPNVGSTFFVEIPILTETEANQLADKNNAMPLPA